MRKPLIATTAACLLSVGLTGCGNQSPASQSAEELETLIAQMNRQLSAPATPMEGNKRLYSGGATVQDVEIPPVHSSEAAYIDQSLALLPLAQNVAATGNDAQKSAANGIIAMILSDEAAYLITVSQQGFQSTANEVGGLRQEIASIENNIAISRQLSGDRSAEIETYRTGKVDDNTSVQGISQLTEVAADAEKDAQAARAELAKLNEQIDKLRDEVAEYESLELSLSNQALSAEGAARFEKLDQATTAAYEAQTAEAQAESLGLDADIQEGQAELAEVRQAGSEAVVKVLEGKIEQVEAEKRLIAGKLAELETDRKTMVTQLTAEFSSLDTEMRVLGFDRMAKAQKKLEAAGQALTGAKIGGGAGQDQSMAIYLLRARSLQQQSLSARSYAALLESLAASGPDVLGPGLHTAMTDRIKDMQALAEKSAKDATKLAEEVDSNGTADSIEGAADVSTDEGQAAVEQVQLYRGLIQSARSGAAAE